MKTELISSRTTWGIVRLVAALSLALSWVAGTPAAPAHTAPITIPLSDFVIFSGGAGTGNSGGFETSIGGHTHVIGNIGSNEDLFQQGNPLLGYPAQLDGSAYAGVNLTFGQELTVGDAGHLRQVVVNGAATINSGVTIWGTLDANSATLGSSPAPVITGGVTAPSSTTFALISMPAATVFTAGGANQTVPSGSGSSLTLAPGTYGALATSAQNQIVILSSGNYYFQLDHHSGRLHAGNRPDVRQPHQHLRRRRCRFCGAPDALGQGLGNGRRLRAHKQCEAVGRPYLHGDSWCFQHERG